MCCVFISEQTATCATYSINRLVFIIEVKSVYCAVRTGSLNKAFCASSLKGLISRTVCESDPIDQVTILTDPSSVFTNIQDKVLRRASTVPRLLLWFTFLCK